MLPSLFSIRPISPIRDDASLSVLYPTYLCLIVYLIWRLLSKSTPTISRDLVHHYPLGIMLDSVPLCVMLATPAGGGGGCGPQWPADAIRQGWDDGGRSERGGNARPWPPDGLLSTSANRAPSELP